MSLTNSPPLKTFIVGDVHGCFLELKHLLEVAGVNLSRHRVIFVGDLINKGPDSMRVLNWVRDYGAEVTIGNHELRFLKEVSRKKSMSPRLKELALSMGSDLALWMGWLDSLPSYIEDKDFFVVHGGLQPGVSPQKTDRKILANIRTWEGENRQLFRPGAPSWHSFYKGKKQVFYGHWALQGLHQNNNTHCLDSGCVYGKFLTGIWAETLEMVHVRAKKVYIPLL